MPESAKALAGFRGDGLTLCGLTTLGADTAKALADFGRDKPSEGGLMGCLFLDGLTTLSDEAAEALADFKDDYLSMGGLTKLTPEAAKALAVFKGSGLSIDHLNAIATSSQAARGTKDDFPIAVPSRMPKSPAQVAAAPPVAAPQSGTFAWHWLLGSAFLLTALVVYLAGRRPPCRNNTPTRPPHKIA
jgi:hypothetical protein